MKKLLFALLALTSLTFVSCEGKKDNGGDDKPGTYAVKVTPSTVALDGEITFTIEGDLSDFDMWQVCYNEGTEVAAGTCLTPFEDGSKTQTWNVSDLRLEAGKTYTVEGHLFVGYEKKGHTSPATFTVAE